MSLTLLPTPRLLFWVLTALLLWAASGLVSFLLVLALLVAVWITAVLYADSQRTPPPDSLTIVRDHHGKMGLGADNIVALLITNQSAFPLDFIVRDEPPADFRIMRGSPRMAARVEANHTLRLTYEVRPMRRGDHLFGNVTIRCTSVLGLFVRQTTQTVSTKVKVYPNLLKISQAERLARLGKIPAGVRYSRQVGEAGTFDQLRDYVPDDDFRRINWKATARHGKLISSDYSPERSQNILILVEMGQQMLTRPLGVLRTTRLDLVVNAVLMFSYTAISRGDRVGLLLFDEQIRSYLPPRPGEGQFYYVVEALYDAQGRPVDPDYGLALRYVRAQRQRRSLLVLLTDPTSQVAAEGLVSQLGAFYPHHLPLCVTLSDTAVIETARRSPYSIQAIYERSIAEQIVDQRHLWLQRLNQRGVMTLDVPAYQLTSAVLNKYLELKEQGRI
ncbi:MAG: DUF58 domain-containing protein [Ardenticatenaceae bacterium]|nr:DUF58 domain-containing protein [Ardenticatenaceae bacterium]